MMGENRIYGSKVDISSANTRDFYDRRARKLSGGGMGEAFACPYTAVLLGDQDPGHAQEWNIFERDHILPKLDITEGSDVLDIGCGMGRWAEHVIPRCRSYCGVDFSSGMIHAAEERDYGRAGNYMFLNDSLQGFLEKKAGELAGRFDRLILAGVCMYINDGELSGCLRELLAMFRGNAVLYITETVGIGRRLTLREFHSEALGCDYDAIYRTPDEYVEMFGAMERDGYGVMESGFLPKLNSEEAFRETGRWYSIYQKAAG